MRNWQCPRYSECLSIAARTDSHKLGCADCEYRDTKIRVESPDHFELEGLQKLLMTIFERPISIRTERQFPLKLSPDWPPSQWKITPTPGSPGTPPWLDKK
jgi:hypothetical protein